MIGLRDWNMTKLGGYRSDSLMSEHSLWDSFERWATIHLRWRWHDWSIDYILFFFFFLLLLSASLCLSVSLSLIVFMETPKSALSLTLPSCFLRLRLRSSNSGLLWWGERSSFRSLEGMLWEWVGFQLCEGTRIFFFFFRYLLFGGRWGKGSGFWFFSLIFINRWEKRMMIRVL